MTEDHVPAGASLGPGVTMPMIGFGTWQIRGRAAYESVRAALETGYRQGRPHADQRQGAGEGDQNQKSDPSRIT